MDEILAEAAARSISYLRGRDIRSVFPEREAVLGLQGFVERLPIEPTSEREVLQQLDELGGPETVASGGGRYFGFVTGGATSMALAASWLASTWDQNAALGVMSPTAGVLDTVVGAWLLDLLGLPNGAQHHFMNGTSAANAVCLAAGRDRLLGDVGWDVPNDGLAGSPPLRVVIGAGAHSSVMKALGYVGLGRRNVVVVEANAQGAMIAEALPPVGPPTLVITQAGNVNTGACDPFDLIADHFAGSPSWIHVDGAFGLWAAASEQSGRTALLDGADRANSWATDLHKWLNVTYDSAIAVVRDRADLVRTFDAAAAYIPSSSRLEPLNRGPDMSQRARAIEAWAVLKSLGSAGVADLVDRTCDHAVRLASGLLAGGLQIDNDVVLNQVLVRGESDEMTNAMLTAVQAGGEIWCGGSVWGDRSVIRVSVSGWATTADDVDVAIAALLNAADLWREARPDIT